MIAPASRKIGKYEILHKLGRGGMADVYLAQDTALNATVALKLIEHAPDADTRDFIEAERRGAMLQAHLAAVDPHVVRIYESGDADGFFYVSMEYIDGQDLSDLLRGGPLPPDQAVSIARAVAQTLESAHTLQVAIEGKNFQGVVHGDIKPKNIRVDSHGQVRVLDFGIAKALSVSRRLTRNEFGSVSYGSPERLELGQVNVQSDLWSLAVMLYEMVTGAQPFRASTTELLEKMIRSRVPPAPVPEPCPEPLRRILMKAMAPEPEMRYQSAREFDDDLAAFQNGQPVRAVMEDLDATRRTAPPSDGGETRRTGTYSEEETRRTSPATAVALEEDTGRTVPQTAAPGARIHWGEWPPKTPKKRRLGAKIVLGVMLFFAGFIGLIVISDLITYRRGVALAREIESEQLTDTGEIWKRWTELSHGNSTSWYLYTPRKAVKQKFVSTADHVIDSYRNAAPVYESNWNGARDLLAHALAIDPDNSVRGKLRIAEGQIERINGAAHKNAGELNDAVEKFQEAEQLMPSSPDPELGLASAYVSLRDVDKAYDALQKAEKRGYTLGNRDKGLLADAYRDRADRLFWDTRNVRGLPQEKDQVLRAKDDYTRALGLYQSIAPYGNSSANIVRVQNSLDSVNSRLKQIEDESDGGPLEKLKEKEKQLPKWLKPLIHIWR